MPLRTDNALVKAAEVVTRLSRARPEARIDDGWRRFVQGLDLPPDDERDLLDPQRLDSYCRRIEDVGWARTVHASTHMTVAPTIAHGGVKTNVIPDTVELQVDVRTLPGETGADVRAMLDEALGDLRGEVEVVSDSDEEASASPVDTPLWDSLTRVTRALAPDATLVPVITVGATDSRFFRRRGVPAYGYGLFSRRLGFGEFMGMFHGDDERIDQESLRLSTELWEALIQDYLG